MDRGDRKEDAGTGADLWSQSGDLTNGGPKFDKHVSYGHLNAQAAPRQAGRYVLLCCSVEGSPLTHF